MHPYCIQVCRWSTYSGADAGCQDSASVWRKHSWPVQCPMLSPAKAANCMLWPMPEWAVPSDRLRGRA
eukprot:6277262-Amphidinium_carterae.1